MVTLSERDWHQIRAALIFWRATVKSSRIHPMEHRAVRHLFTGDHYTPLTDEELDRLIHLDLIIPTCTIEEAIYNKRRYIKPRQVRRWLWDHGRKRITRRGREAIFRVSDLRDAIRDLMRQYDEKKQKAKSRNRTT